VQSFVKLAERQAARTAFRDSDTNAWLIEHHGFQPPGAVRNTHIVAAALTA
jgi:hypothetical protein